jgi:hypothetical protein
VKTKTTNQARWTANKATRDWKKLKQLQEQLPREDPTISAGAVNCYPDKGKQVILVSSFGERKGG